MKNLNKITPEDGMILSGSEMKEIAGGGELDPVCYFCEHPSCVFQVCAIGICMPDPEGGDLPICVLPPL